MRRTDGLFQLIKALNRTDKRNFKLLTQLTSGTKNYIRLFDAIDRQDLYDEKKIIRQFKSDAMVKQFSVTKNYLYHNILKSLSYFEKGTFAELSTVIVQVQSLLDKNLLPHAKKLLKKAKVLASQQESFQQMVELLEMERQLLLEEQSFKHYKERIEEIHAEERLFREKAQNLLAYRHLMDRMNGIITASRQARNGDDLEEIYNLVADP
ncbi:MAG TPA: hypothetical protein ENJ82_06750, partial [Bacteroidetes bacterium]|nr:hypothetical protein [Bacteroidota bacterium]